MSEKNNRKLHTLSYFRIFFLILRKSSTTQEGYDVMKFVDFAASQGAGPCEVEVEKPLRRKFYCNSVILIKVLLLLIDYIATNRKVISCVNTSWKLTNESLVFSH